MAHTEHRDERDFGQGAEGYRFKGFLPLEPLNVVHPHVAVRLAAQFEQTAEQKRKERNLRQWAANLRLAAGYATEAVTALWEAEQFRDAAESEERKDSHA